MLPFATADVVGDVENQASLGSQHPVGAAATPGSLQPDVTGIDLLRRRTG